MPKNKILLTILPVFWPKMPPIGLGYLQSYLIGNGFEADILDLNNLFYNLSDKELQKQWLISCNVFLERNISNIIKCRYPDVYNDAINQMVNYNVIGFSCFKSNFFTTLESIKILKERKKDIKIILGGPEITRQFFKGRGKFDNNISELVDFLVVGEGEIPVIDYLKGANKRKKASIFEQVDSLEKLYAPKYFGLNINSYIRKESIPLQFSRGCIRKCNFCSERLLFKGYRTRDVKSVIEEIKYHKKHNNTEYFVFFDSLINGDLELLDVLCEAIISNFGAINWEAQIVIRNDMEQDLFKKIKRSGCYNLFVGLESGSDNTLRNMNKGYSSQEAVCFFEKLNKAGLFFGVSIIVGYPGETDSHFKESLEFILKNKDIIPKIEQVNPFTYYDGTNVDKNGDYKVNVNSLDRMNTFVDAVKNNQLKYTNAFLGNLIEKTELVLEDAG